MSCYILQYNLIYNSLITQYKILIKFHILYSYTVNIIDLSYTD